MTTKREALQASVFGRLRPSQLDEVARTSDERHFAAGSCLCHQGALAEEVFVIGSGRVAVESDGRQLAVLGPGELAGDWAMLGTGYRTATLRAVTPVTVVVVEPADVDALAAAVPAAAPRIAAATGA